MPKVTPTPIAILPPDDSREESCAGAVDDGDRTEVCVCAAVLRFSKDESEGEMSEDFQFSWIKGAPKVARDSFQRT